MENKYIKEGHEKLLLFGKNIVQGPTY